MEEQFQAVLRSSQTASLRLRGANFPDGLNPSPEKPGLRVEQGTRQHLPSHPLDSSTGIHWEAV